jgi:acetolactate synthase-1/2/3 large subunit
MNITVSEVIVRFMRRLGISHVFGMPGAHILPVYDRLRATDIRTVLVKHEQGAAFMAGGYQRASGGIGACIATAGPGATNLITGIANAYVDKQPILIITGETPTYIFGRGGLQESSGEGGTVDQAILFTGLTRYHKLVERTDYLESVLNHAARILLNEPSGPVLLSLPYNVQHESVDAALLERLPEAASRPRASIAARDIAALRDLLGAARRPAIVAGAGCLRAHAQAVVARLSEALNIPVATTLKAKGVLGERAPLALGSLGVTSSGVAYQYIAEQADLVVFLGAGFNERTSYVWDAKLLAGKRVVQIDHDFAQLGKVMKPDLAIQGDIRVVLEALLAELAGGAAGDAATLRAELARARAEVTRDYALFQSGFALIERFFQALEQRYADSAAIYDDNIIFAQNFYNVGPGGRYHPNSGISSLGHAIPAAIGARFAESRPTFAILGDGGFQMCGFELMTAVNYAIPINVVVFNNGTMGLIRKNQYQHYGQRYIDCDFINPDFEKLAAAFGIGYKKIVREADIDDLFARHDLAGAINLIEIVLDKDLFPNYSSRR